MWNLSLPWWEFVLRAVLVYGFLLLILRLTGKRQIGQMSPFDLVLLLVLSNAVQNSMNGGDNTVAGGFILAGTLVAFNALIGFIVSRNPVVEKWIEGVPQVLVFEGKVMKKTLASEGLTMDELQGAMRAAGCAEIKDVHLATLEINGQISIVREDTPDGQAPKVYRVTRSMRRKGRRSGYGG
jgi:uncharacterized membrane protein YcaP (DUF421 family)